jgi:enoyl-CoA hydratase/carnithine racemase
MDCIEAVRLIASGRNIDADEAREAGLVDVVVSVAAAPSRPPWPCCATT